MYRWNYLNALFDAVSVTYLGLWGIGEWTVSSSDGLMSGYLVLLFLVVFVGTLGVAVPDIEHEDSRRGIYCASTIPGRVVSVAVPNTAGSDDDDDDGSGKEQRHNIAGTRVQLLNESGDDTCKQRTGEG
jgi:hypothetical protein